MHFLLQGPVLPRRSGELYSYVPQLTVLPRGFILGVAVRLPSQRDPPPGGQLHLQQRDVQGAERSGSSGRLAVRRLPCDKVLPAWRRDRLSGWLHLPWQHDHPSDLPARLLLSCVSGNPYPLSGRHLRSQHGHRQSCRLLALWLRTLFRRSWVLGLRHLPDPHQHHRDQRGLGIAVRVRSWVLYVGQFVRQVRLRHLFLPGSGRRLHLVS